MTNLQDRVAFGSRLREKREAKAITLADLAKATKVPEKQLERLEGGAFDELPADVFVRGFLKSYCRAVGLDVDGTIVAYGELARKEKGKKEFSLARPGSAGGDPQPREPAVARAPSASLDGDKDKDKEKDKASEESSVFQALADAGRGTSRVSLTLAVIILVIVATLTLSLLLRRPSHVGDGLSRVETLDARASTLD